MADRLEPIGRIGSGLRRPECVLVSRNDEVFVSDARGGVSRLEANGTSVHLPCPGGTTNGVAQDRDGSLILAGIDTGQVHRLHPDGYATLVIERFEGAPLGAANFVHFDPEGGLWITVSTRTQPRSRAIAAPIPDGYVLKQTRDGFKLMAQGLCFANEIRFAPDMSSAYLAESARGRVLRMAVLADGSLGPPAPFGPDPLFPGAVVDGLAFDVEGGLWVTEVTRNAIYRIDADGQAQCWFEDPKAEVMDFPASLAFAGPDRRTVLVGSIRMDCLIEFRSPVAGAAMWHHG
ncbi:smp-30 gluconolaconase lre domain protein [Novosphingobium sp. Rr 2-17]|uniref:SMP-30/gluconolactonase/LRE family protein n=1 Tax=Novosphingobium sp. Rr 2-17 TaxID=555793 RepID=UPI0002697BA1|nr:SMP-30/gluconolactonase/LRE family protein [Novosphingobium sp. Rr 2-17]EIZ78333.1 smp-30 gluconolaconase lre domain protein [Novosphingobium sp. Rr 2-17]